MRRFQNSFEWCSAWWNLKKILKHYECQGRANIFVRWPHWPLLRLLDQISVKYDNSNVIDWPSDRMRPLGLMLPFPALYNKINKAVKGTFRGKWLISNTGISTSKNLSSKTVISNSEIGYGPPWGGVGGWLLMMIGDAMTPFDPVLAPFWPRFTPF